MTLPWIRPRSRDSLSMAGKYRGDAVGASIEIIDMPVKLIKADDAFRVSAL